MMETKYRGHIYGVLGSKRESAAVLGGAVLSILGIVSSV